jgi:predicted GNAT family acetyltransferase
MISSVIEDRFVVGLLAGKNLIIAANTLETDVYDDLISYMNQIDYPGIIGVKEHCERYQKSYQSITGKTLNIQMYQRIYACKKVIDQSVNKGKVRLAVETDIDDLVSWAYHFSKDVGDTVSMEEARKNLEYQVANKTLYVLCVEEVLVSMAARSRSLNLTESVGYVYTPIEFRNHGYASQIVAEVTRKVLADGKIATLYTDLSNPTSNSIYMRIGYEPYCDSVMMIK